MSDKRNQNRGLSRRHFLSGIAGGTVATVVLPGLNGLLPGTAAAGEESPGAKMSKRDGPTVRLHRARLPILRQADVVVIGGALAGVAAALELARAGRKVVLVEHRNYLGRDISATLKPWVDLGKLAGEPPEPFAACLKKMQADGQPIAAAGEIPLWMDAFKVTTEDVLLEAGAELVYSSLPTEVIVSAGAIRGVVIGNKSGRQALLGRMVIDASSTAVVARIAGGRFEPQKDEDFDFVRRLELEGVGPLNQTTIEIPAELGVSGNKLTIHRGYRGADHVLIECPMQLKLGKMDLPGMMQREIEARHRTMRVASHLIKQVSAFSKAKLGICAYELDGPQTTRLAGPAPERTAGLGALSVEFSDQNHGKISMPLAAFAGPVSGLWCLGDAARLEDAQRALLRDPVGAVLAGAAFAKALLSKPGSGAIPSADSADYTVPEGLPHTLEVKSQDSPQRGRFYDRLDVPAVDVPVLRETDFVVVGGGTTGASCANSAGREGLKTVLLELAPGLGGAATVGGVCAYWYGRYWTGFCLRNAKLVDEVHESINWPLHANKLNGPWNIEAKMYALLKDAHVASVEVFFNTTTFAAVLQDNQVRGVVAATPYGPMAVLAKVTADTTGDGDVAAFAGAKFFFGAARDHYPMWFNLAQFPTPTKSNWHFGHTIDVTNVEDYTQGVLIGRRRGPKVHDHGPYIATRESRHIVGDVTVTLTDLLRHRAFPDVINFGAGQMDCHRRVASDWIRMGLLIPILPTEMPLRAVLPRGLENILVGGKAFSGAHDALYNLRNQPEMENLGGALGVVAAYAIKDGVTPRQVDLPKVQKRLVEVGTLLPDMLTRRIDVKPLDEAAIRAFVKELDGTHFSVWWDVQMAKENEPNFRKKIPIVEICTSDPALAVPILEEELAQANGERQIRLAQGLAMFGANTAVPVLIAAIEATFADGPVSTGASQTTKIFGQGGLVMVPADLLYSLAMCRDSRSLAVWDKMVDRIKTHPIDFSGELPPVFHFVDSICYGADLLGDPAAIPILKKLHSRPTLNHQSAKEGIQTDFSLEKRSLVELTLGRTLARLGDPEGYETLIAYLDDNRANMAEFAHLALEELTGRYNGKDPQAWNQWQAAAKSSLKPIPLLERVDG